MGLTDPLLLAPLMCRSCAPHPLNTVYRVPVGDVDTEVDKWWGRPEQQPEPDRRHTLGYRPVHVITADTGAGADILGEAVATLVGASLVLKRPGTYSNPTKAATLLTRAKQLFELAKTLKNT
ncbi:hypothetical protein PLESTB_001144800 [Pleodorina starrii]|uniref:cellulase n=1 Tax=Pleodorina starrii TaxID=330485 RepID=A0A9W6BR14_9CHLO|nr:hypothetical protein PLESTB_001144800 [Pleodorina starrii]